MMSKGDSRTNGITERKSTNRSDREDQDIGHIFSSLMSAAAPSPPAEKGQRFHNRHRRQGLQTSAMAANAQIA
jgi:hypothetical protein